MSSRVPIFRCLPREGIPPHYGTWEIFSHRVEMMMRAGAIEDYTFLWWDVRPHPNLGTVETRIFDQQTRVEHTISLAALVVSARPPAVLALRRRRAADRVPDRADRRQQGPRRAPRHRRPADRLPRRRAGAGAGDGPRADRAARPARRRRSAAPTSSPGSRTCSTDGTGAHRQLAIAERNGDDLRALAAEIAEATSRNAPAAVGNTRGRWPVPSSPSSARAAAPR